MPGLFISHVVGVRYRALGQGHVLSKLISLSGMTEQNLVPLQINQFNQNYNTLLSNFNQFQVKLRIEINEENEHFHFKEIILYTKPIATGLPQ